MQPKEPRSLNAAQMGLPQSAVFQLQAEGVNTVECPMSPRQRWLCDINDESPI